MKLLDIFDVAHNALSLMDGASKKKSKVPFILYIALVPALLWFVFELPYTTLLSALSWFLLLFIPVGVILSFLIAYVLWRVRMIDYYTPKSFLVLSVIICLLTLSLASFANRQFSTEINPQRSKGGLGFELSKTVLSKNRKH